MSKNDIKLTPRPMDMLFKAPKQNEGAPTMLAIDRLVPYPHHPFKLYEGERLDMMVESVKQNGIITPIIVRPRGDNSYEILAGHNRVNAAKIAGLKETPAFVNDVDDDTAALIVVETNLSQRSTTDMLPSEKARAYKMQLDVLKRQGKRSDLTSDQNGLKFSSADEVADMNNTSAAQIKRFIRLNYLTDKLMDFIDDGKISLDCGATLSFLPVERQETVYRLTTGNEKALKPDVVKELRRMSDDEDWNEQKVKETIFPPVHKKVTKFLKIKIDLSDLGDIAADMDEKKLKQEFIEFLKQRKTE